MIYKNTCRRILSIHADNNNYYLLEVVHQKSQLMVVFYSVGPTPPRTLKRRHSKIAIALADDLVFTKCVAISAGGLEITIADALKEIGSREDTHYFDYQLLDNQ